MAKNTTGRSNGTLGGVDFRASGSESAGSDSNSDAGINSGDSSDSIGTGDNSNEGNTGESTIAGFRAVDPGTESGKYGFKPDGTPRGKPGRKPGASGPRASSGKSGGKAASSNQSVDGIARILFSLHQMAAVGLKVPEMALDPKEAQVLGQAIADVQSHYDFDVSAETTIWVNLVMALGSVYGPRAVLIYHRKQKVKEKSRPLASVSEIKSTEKGNTIFDIPGMHSGPVQ
jgi:hypothetical protein